MSAALRVDHLEILALAKIAGSIWTLTTTSKLAKVITPEYWTRFESYALRVHDRINVIASYSAPEAEHATLLVMSADKHGVKVREL